MHGQVATEMVPQRRRLYGRGWGGGEEKGYREKLVTYQGEKKIIHRE